MFLTAAQIRELTKRRKHNAQRAVLNTLKIKHGVRPDGSLVVLQSHVDNTYGGILPPDKQHKAEPNWEFING